MIFEEDKNAAFRFVRKAAFMMALFEHGNIEGDFQLFKDDAREVLHILGQIQSLAVAEVEMAFVIGIENRMALDAVLQIQRIGYINLRNEHHGV